MDNGEEPKKWRFRDYVMVAVLIYAFCGLTYVMFFQKKQPKPIPASAYREPSLQEMLDATAPFGPED